MVNLITRMDSMGIVLWKVIVSMEILWHGARFEIVQRVISFMGISW